MPDVKRPHRILTDSERGRVAVYLVLALSVINFALNMLELFH